MITEVVIPKHDIVLSNGMFLKRGLKVEITLDEKEFSLLAPYLRVEVKPIPSTDEPIKKKTKKAKNELD